VKPARLREQAKTDLSDVAFRYALEGVRAWGRIAWVLLLMRWTCWPRSPVWVHCGGRSLRSNHTAAFAVSVEPSGGSPTGAPTGPIVSVGKLQI